MCVSASGILISGANRKIIRMSTEKNKPTFFTRLELRGRERRAEIDVAKGIGILSVVIGHIFTGAIVPVIFLWHMPFFFFISGRLFSPRQDAIGYAASKAKSLLVPYVSFLLLFSLPFLLKAAKAHPSELGGLVSNMLYGGARLTSWFGVFWFLTCLFFTQQLANFIVIYARKITVMLCSISALVALLMASWVPEIETPWGLHVVFMALPIFILGYLTRTGFMCAYARRIAIFGPIALIAVGAGVLGAFDMKHGRYGTPVISLVAAISVIFFVLEAAKLVTRYERSSKVLVFFGRASMTIMFTHQAVQLSLLAVGVGSPFLRVVIALAVGLITHVLLTKTKFTRRFFLGRFEGKLPPRLAGA